MWNDLLRAVSLVLVIEGVLPFLAPARSKRMFTRLAQADDRVLRVIGLGSMIAGLVSLQLVRWFL